MKVEVLLCVLVEHKHTSVVKEELLSNTNPLFMQQQYDRHHLTDLTTCKYYKILVNPLAYIDLDSTSELSCGSSI